jgi:D-tagatose-1,6-bisphosphate aldolase subunit GatZ/KbaZ
LEKAWERVLALVVQPGVEFGDASIHPYRREQAAGLKRMIEEHPGLVYEAHSTDYQTPEALRELVEDHFAILKVGPALTFAFREAVFALEWIERELLADQPDRFSNLQAVVEREMVEHPAHWIRYYHVSPEEQRIARRYSLSDRIRYYWVRPPVQQALARLLGNLQNQPIPLTLVSQFFPEQYWQIRDGSLANTPAELICGQIRKVVADYQYACYSERTE